MTPPGGDHESSRVVETTSFFLSRSDGRDPLSIERRCVFYFSGRAAHSFIRRERRGPTEEEPTTRGKKEGASERTRGRTGPKERGFFPPTRRTSGGTVVASLGRSEGKECSRATDGKGPYSFWRCFRYSSKDGAAEIDWRGSSSFLNGSGSRVSALRTKNILGKRHKWTHMPPLPSSGSENVTTARCGAITCIGTAVNAAADPSTASAEMTFMMLLLVCWRCAYVCHSRELARDCNLPTSHEPFPFRRRTTWCRNRRFCLSPSDC